MTTANPVPSACGAFFAGVGWKATPLHGGGFSGSARMLVEADDGGHESGKWVVKAFPSATPIEHAAFVHRLMRHLRSAGLRGVGEPRVARGNGGTGPCTLVGDTLVRDADGLLWEAIRFLPGHPRETPSEGAVAAAMTALAAIHVAGALLPEQAARERVSRGVVSRSRRAAELLGRPWRRRLETVGGGVGDHRVHDLIMTAVGRMAHGGDAALRRIAAWPATVVAVQPVLRDIWRDHVLFDGDRVSGVVDFHSAGIDTVATDLARLVGSWRESAAGRPEWLSWDRCLDAYASTRPLGSEERRLAPLLHHAGVIVGIDNWFRWIVEERRTFPDADGVVRRLDQLVACLPAAIDALSS